MWLERSCVNGRTRARQGTTASDRARIASPREQKGARAHSPYNPHMQRSFADARNAALAAGVAARLARRSPEGFFQSITREGPCSGNHPMKAAARSPVCFTQPLPSFADRESGIGPNPNWNMGKPGGIPHLCPRRRKTKPGVPYASVCLTEIDRIAGQEKSFLSPYTRTKRSLAHLVRKPMHVSNFVSITKHLELACSIETIVCRRSAVPVIESESTNSRKERQEKC